MSVLRSFSFFSSFSVWLNNNHVHLCCLALTLNPQADKLIPKNFTSNKCSEITSQIFSDGHNKMKTSSAITLDSPRYWPFLLSFFVYHSATKERITSSLQFLLQGEKSFLIQRTVLWWSWWQELLSVREQVSKLLLSLWI